MSDFDERARRAARAVNDHVSRDPVDTQGVTRIKRSVRRSRMSNLAAGVATLVVITTIGVNAGSPGHDLDNIAFTNEGTPFELATSLHAFDECDDALAYFKREAPDRLADGRWLSQSPEMPVARETLDFDTSTGSAPATDDAGADRSVSRTNVAEAGVDEPDTIKTDGKRIVTVTNQEVQLLAITDSGPQLRGRLHDIAAETILMHDDRLLVLGWSKPQLDSRDPAGGTVMYSQIALYDIGDLAKPSLLSKLEVTGNVVDARLVDSRVRLVTLSAPRVNISLPTYDNGAITEQSKQDIRAAVERSTIDQWIPTFTLTDDSGKKVADGSLVDCDSLAVPERFSGLDTLAVTSFDLEETLDVDDAAGVVAGGQTVYATARNLYVSTTDYSPRTQSSAAQTSTQIHRFSTSTHGNTTYEASGEVPGVLLNQYSMSERNDVLRVASTVSSPGSVFKGSSRQGMVSTLAKEGAVLTVRGQLGGLGAEDNESIRAVRFIGDRGYVVTFRQTDPLYVIDLSDPAKPREVGELKIPGYSGYLHPIGEDRLLGVGQAGPAMAVDPCRECDVPGSSKERARPIAPTSGVQFSLFDISDPADPKRVATKNYDNGQALAEHDAKAFLYWQPRDLVVAPMQTFSANKTFQGAVLLKVTKDGITEVGRVEERPGEQVTRSAIIDSQLYTLSYSAISQTDLERNALVTRVELSSSSKGSGGAAATAPSSQPLPLPAPTEGQTANG